MFNRKKIKRLEEKVESLQQDIHRIQSNQRTSAFLDESDVWRCICEPTLTANEIAVRIKEIYDHLGVERVSEPKKTTLKPRENQ